MHEMSTPHPPPPVVQVSFYPCGSRFDVGMPLSTSIARPVIDVEAQIGPFLEISYYLERVCFFLYIKPARCLNIPR